MSYKVTVLLVLGLFGLVSYLLGSINFAIIVTKIFTGRDIRRSGSGKNVRRLRLPPSGYPGRHWAGDWPLLL